jgi:predicted nucleotidyltransferase
MPLTGMHGETGTTCEPHQAWFSACLIDNHFSYGVAMVAQEVIDAAGQTLATVATDPVKIVLFGSHARGDAGPDSDFDFLVVERDPPDRHAEMVRLGRALRPLGMPFDIVVVSERYAEDWGSVEGSMVHAALSEGRVLHVAT